MSTNRFCDLCGKEVTHWLHDLKIELRRGSVTLRFRGATLDMVGNGKILPDLCSECVARVVYGGNTEWTFSGPTRTLGTKE